MAVGQVTVRLRNRTSGALSAPVVLDYTVAAGPLVNVLADPQAHGWPGPGNTGVPTGVTLASSNGLTISTNGTVVQDLHINGGVTVNGSDVLIRRCRITKGLSSGQYAVKVNGARLRVEDCEIVGGNISVYGPSLPNSYSLYRCHIHSMHDGPRVESDDVTIADCYIHGLIRVEGGHHDGIQWRDGDRMRLIHNTVLAYAIRPDGSVDNMNGGLQMGSNKRAGRGCWDMLIEDNLWDGGGFQLRGPRSEDARAAVRGNRFGTKFTFGYHNADLPADGVWQGNVRDDTGDAIDP